MNKKSYSASLRLKQDYLHLKRDPAPYIIAEPLPTNILQWHFVLNGPENTPYEGGKYHGKLEFCPEYPFKPPSIYMITPNGRFKTNRSICLSYSSYHPETWNPAWNVSTILMGLLSAMTDDKNTTGLYSLQLSASERRQLAFKSLEFNLKNPIFCELFPSSVKDIKLELAERKKQVTGARATTSFVDNEDENTLISFVVCFFIACIIYYFGQG